eukprot:3237541-Prymnesium_polylepis.1
MPVELHIAGNVLGVRCVPSRRSDRCTWCESDGTPRREESMVPGATSAKEGARVGHAHPLLTRT